MREENPEQKKIHYKLMTISPRRIPSAYYESLLWMKSDRKKPSPNKRNLQKPTQINIAIRNVT